MRTVLVCVRTPLAAQNIAAVAARLGMTGAVRAASSAPEVMLRLAERPPDVVLADTALTRPDSAGFVRRVLARAPGASVLLFGMEERGATAGVIAAGARGLIHGSEHDLASVVAKALLLLAAPGRTGERSTRDALPGAVPARLAGKPGAQGRSAAVGGGSGGPLGVVATPGGAPPVVPVQRAEDLKGEEPGPAVGETVQASGADPAGMEPPRAGGPTAGRPDLPETKPGALWVQAIHLGGDRVDGDPPQGEPGAPASTRRIVLTERELQVLLGMADGKSNAEIGRELYVSEDTVKTHARRLFRKLGARDRAHAVAAGFRAGLVA